MRWKVSQCSKDRVEVDIQAAGRRTIGVECQIIAIGVEGVERDVGRRISRKCHEAVGYSRRRYWDPL